MDLMSGEAAAFFPPSRTEAVFVVGSSMVATVLTGMVTPSEKAPFSSFQVVAIFP
jgi:hypothetical protein